MPIKFYFHVCLIALACGVLPSTARADIVNMFAKVECSERLNYLRVDVFNVNGNLPLKLEKKNGASLRQKDNIVSYDSLVDIDKDFYQKKKGEFVTTCPLQEVVENKHGNDSVYKTVTYTVIIEPHFFNTNREGECGGADSFTITIKNKDHVLVDHVPSWSNCGKRISSDIEDQTVNTIIFPPHEGYISFYGSYSSPIGPDIYPSLARTFPIDKNIPITAEKLYSRH